MPQFWTCLKNNYDVSLLNGEWYIIISSKSKDNFFAKYIAKVIDYYLKRQSMPKQHPITKQYINEIQINSNLHTDVCKLISSNHIEKLDIFF